MSTIDRIGAPPTADGSDPGFAYDQLECSLGRGREAELESEVAQLREALVTRQRLGFVTGLLAHRFGLSADDAWELLSRVSQNNNIKAREVARLLHDGYGGRLEGEEWALAAQLSDQLAEVHRRQGETHR